ncbi:MAG: outer membrane lipoprotein-sorting protein [Gemmatimonadetes bacterium]|nr:outer membrane lipoprotein-sorting protein [Gemmatimonadota bacterium]
MLTSRSLVLVAFLAAASSSGLHAQASTEDLPTGDEVAQHINARDEGQWVSRTLRMEMIDRRGGRRVRETRGFRRYYGDEKRTVIFYESPANVKGTGFLTFDYRDRDKDDDQWLYLPALRRVRRISASDRGDYFLGTDFTYEDIKLETKVGLDDYTRRTIGRDTLDGHEVYVVEETPVDEDTAKELGYSRVVRYVDAEIWMTRKVEMWDIRGNQLKTIHISDIREVQGIWTAHRMEVENHKTGHRTIFTFADVDYETGVPDDVFTQRALRRGR